MGLKKKITAFFLEQPRPAAIIQMSPSFFSFLKTKPEGSISEEFFKRERIPAGLIEAHLLQPNLKDPEALEKLIDEALDEFRPQGNSVTLLIPEMSSRVFIFNLEGNLMSPSEITRFVEWRLDRQLSQPLDQIRYSYQTFNSGQEKRIMVLCSGNQVVKEYERFLKRKKLQPGKLTIPSLSVFSLVSSYGLAADDVLVVDVDLDYLSLIVVLDTSPYLYRQKHLWPGEAENLETVLREVENTVSFLEEKFKKKQVLIYLRSGLDNSNRLKLEIQNRLRQEVREIMTENPGVAPLIGGQ
jgi:Tfp pilus assembly PilM family ATPase